MESWILFLEQHGSVFTSNSTGRSGTNLLSTVASLPTTRLRHTPLPFVGDPTGQMDALDAASGVARSAYFTRIRYGGGSVKPKGFVSFLFSIID